MQQVQDDPTRRDADQRRYGVVEGRKNNIAVDFCGCFLCIENSDAANDSCCRVADNVDAYQVGVYRQVIVGEL